MLTGERSYSEGQKRKQGKAKQNYKGSEPTNSCFLINNQFPSPLRFLDCFGSTQPSAIHRLIEERVDEQIGPPNRVRSNLVEIFSQQGRFYSVEIAFDFFFLPTAADAVLCLQATIYDYGEYTAVFVS